ncbi:MAG TPA: hypothetical protein VIK51_06560, partial [Vicinamibacteria bacterium]
LAEHRRSLMEASSPASVPAHEHPRAETLLAENARLRHDVEIIRKSLTWRLSAPLRHLLDRLRG